MQYSVDQFRSTARAKIIGTSWRSGTAAAAAHTGTPPCHHHHHHQPYLPTTLPPPPPPPTVPTYHPPTVRERWPWCGECSRSNSRETSLEHFEVCSIILSVETSLWINIYSGGVSSGSCVLSVREGEILGGSLRGWKRIQFLCLLWQYLVIKKCRSLSRKNVRTAAMGWMITNTTHTNTQPSPPRPMATANTGRQSPGPSWCSIVSRLTDHLQASYPDSPTSRNSTRRSPNAMISPVRM